jgi:hypothetical protein
MGSTTSYGTLVPPRNSNKRPCHYFPSTIPMFVASRDDPPAAEPKSLAVQSPAAVPLPTTDPSRLVAEPKSLAILSPVAATRPLAVTTRVAVPSPVDATSTLAAIAPGVLAVPSPVDATSTLAAIAHGVLAVQSPVVATRPLAAAAPVPPTAKAMLSPAPAPIAATLEQAPAIALASLSVAGSYRLRPDNLGKSALSLALLLESGMSFEELCVHHRGASCLADPKLLPHTAAPILSTLRSTGAPAHLSSAQWTEGQRDAATKRGPHKGTHEHIEFMRAEFFDMVNAGQWLVLPYQAVRELPNLRISPTGVVPQRDRRPRPIVDYTFSEVNDATVSQAPDAIQFGAALQRFLQRLERADTRRGPIKLAKTDISDAFMRVWISLQTIPCLGAILPSYPDEEPLIAFPMILPMGWVDSPNYLCAVTETIADLANARFATNDLSSATHRLNQTARTAPTDTVPGHHDASIRPPPTTRSQGPIKPPLNFTDVYMDDFIAASQLSGADLDRSRATLFESIDSVLRPLLPSDNPHRKDPISIKKLLKGDAAWATRKSILGWTIDTVRRTVELPPHRLARLHELLASIPRGQNRTSRRKWQQLLGELRSMVLAIPGGRGLFSQLQSVLLHAQDPKPTDRLRLSTAVHDQLDDFRWLANELSDRPTRWAEIVDSAPTFLGTVDASGLGMGGTWIPVGPTTAPMLWRLPFSSDIQTALVSSDNPLGTITNSDLEQLALVCHPDILTSHHDVREHTICALSDNTAAISREHRGSSSVDAPSAYLCRLASIHQRTHRYRLKADYLPGPLNVMADDLSRRWDLSDSQILAYFNSTYPQTQPWQLCHLRPALISTTMKALSMQHCAPDSLMADKLPPAPTGVSGQTFVSNTTWTPTCPKDPMQSTGSRFSLSEYELAGFPPPITLSELTRWQMPSLTLARRTQWPTTPTLDMYRELPHSIRNWPESSTVSANKIPPHPALCHYQSSSSTSRLPSLRNRTLHSPVARRT